MRIVVRVAVIAGLFVAAIVAFLLHHFYQLSVDQGNYIKTEAMRWARWQKKKDGGDDLPPVIEESEPDQTIQIQNRDSDRTAEEQSDVNQNIL